MIINGKEYRKLNVGEIIKDGYFWSTPSKKSYTPVHFPIGSKVTNKCFFYYYRPISKPTKVKKPTYWIELEEQIEGCWMWYVKCINGKIKCEGGVYSCKSLCLNDAKSFADYTKLEIRGK